MADNDEIIRQAVLQQMKTELAIIETACEASIQSGEYGVLVIRDQWSNLLSAEVSSSVPYGRLHEMRIFIDGQQA